MKPPTTVTADGAIIPVEREWTLTVVPSLAFFVATQGHDGEFAVAADVTLPDLLPDHYRPPIRAKGRDGFLPIGASRIGQRRLPGGHPEWRVVCEGEVTGRGTSPDILSLLASLWGEASSFMTLGTGDVFLLPLGQAVPVPADRSVTISVDGIGEVTFTLATR